MSYEIQEDWQQQSPAWRDLQIHKCLCTMKNLIEQLPAGGSTPLVYRALISQSGTNAPVATVLENTLGETPTFAYSSPGAYQLNTVASIFDSAKTFITANASIWTGETTGYVFNVAINDAQSLSLFTGKTVPDAGNLQSYELSENILSNTPIQILIYP